MSYSKRSRSLDGMRSVGFFGLGKSNLELLKIIPADVEITIRSEAPVKASALPPRIRGARIFEGRAAFDSIDEDILFFSPSVRRERRELDEARGKGVIFCSDLELFLSEFGGISFAVSGSDGKSTTATLTSLLLSEKFEKISAVGNVGIPFCKAMRSSAAVLELSSFNLRYSVPSAKRAAITNITPNHLNWHSDFEEYKNTKLSLLDAAEEAVISADDEILSDYGREKRNFAVTSLSQPFDELKRQFRAELYFTADDRYLYKCGEPLAEISKIKRRESHNLKNLMTAAALADGYASRERFIRVASEFGGLEHRCETFLSADGVRYIDSSIDTTPHRTSQTLSSLDGRVVIILGGRTKGCDFSTLCAPLSKKAELAIVTGECRNEIATAIKGSCDVAVIDGFEEAVLYGASTVKHGGTLLLSPAATSYDTFASFEERGEKFKELIINFKNKDKNTK